MSVESAAEYYEYHESREELEAPLWDDEPWVKCAACEEFMNKLMAVSVDGLWFHPGCLHGNPWPRWTSDTDEDESAKEAV